MFNHAFDFAFEVISTLPTDRISGEQLKDACRKRLNELSNEDMLEACNCFDSMDEENE